jgi:hypothetical protein
MEVHKMHFAVPSLELLKDWSSGFPLTSKPHDFNIVEASSIPMLGLFKAYLSTDDIRLCPKSIIHYVKNPKDIGNHGIFVKRLHLAILVHGPFKTTELCFLRDGEMFGDALIGIEATKQTPNNKYNVLFVTEMIGLEDMGVQIVFKGNKTIVAIANNLDAHSQAIKN